MADSPFPYRVRLGRGHVVHAAGHVAGFTDLVTACEKVTGPKDEQLDEDALCTCTRCFARLKN